MIHNPPPEQGLQRLVLDTNVVVALLVFEDPALAVLRERWDEGRYIVLADLETLAELDRVLRYPELRLDEECAASIARRYRERCALIAAGAAVASRLPQCRDPDDQKFLLLTQRGKADALLTRDKALLSLRKRLPFVVSTPEAIRGVKPSRMPALPVSATE